MIQDRTYYQFPPDCIPPYTSGLGALDSTALEGENRNDQRNLAKSGFLEVIDRDLHLLIRKVFEWHLLSYCSSDSTARISEYLG